jgi:hypothetical protein
MSGALTARIMARKSKALAGEPEHNATLQISKSSPLTSLIRSLSFRKQDVSDSIHLSTVSSYLDTQHRPANTLAHSILTFVTETLPIRKMSTEPRNEERVDRVGDDNGDEHLRQTMPGAYTKESFPFATVTIRKLLTLVLVGCPRSSGST